MDYNKELQNIYLARHWSMWASLGVQTHVAPDDKVVDLEALILSTFFLGLREKRLFLAMISWIRSNSQWINKSRMKRIATVFKRRNSGEALTESLKLMMELVKNPEAGIEKIKKSHFQFVELLKGYQPRHVAMPASFCKKPLLQLYYRSIFGINARGDVLLYLSCIKEQNANRLSREIYYDQKAVYRVLLNWEKSELVRKEIKNKEILYSIYKGRGLICPVSVSGLTYYNWTRIFILLRKVFLIVTNPDFIDEPYLLSSRLREVYPELVVVSRTAGFELENDMNYPGESLWYYLKDKLPGIFRGL